MSTLTFEDMIRAETDQFVCRIWRGSIIGDEDSNRQIKAAALGWLSGVAGPISLESAAVNITSFERVSAVEIIDRKTGDGICVYKDWP